MRRRPTPTLAALALALAGCPGPDGPKKDPNGDALPTTGKIAKPVKPPGGDKPAEPARPPAVDLGAFSKAAVIELYRADQQGDEARRRAVQTKHGLLDAQGKETPRLAEYEASLKKLAETCPDEWSALADELDAARVTSETPSGVQKK